MALNFPFLAGSAAHRCGRLIFCGTFLFFVAGCGRSDDEKIIVYRIPKETQPATPSQPSAADSASAPALQWTAPADWEEQTATGFRKGSFLARGADGKTADVLIVSFPEAAGGVLANVNRWRDQLKLAPIASEAEVGAPKEVAGHDLFFVDLASDKPLSDDGEKSRILGGILLLPGETWFFKMSGPDRLVEAQRENFRSFLSSIRLTSAPVTTNAGESTNAPTPPPVAPLQEAALQYQVPSNWQEKPPTSMRVASFSAIAPNEKEADVSIVALPGTAGGDLANVNRWRGQVNLGPIDQDGLAEVAEHVSANGHDFLVVDLVSSAPIGEKNEKQRILAAILNEKGGAWFVKMTGEDAAVESQKSAFLDFLRSLKIP